MGGSSPFSLEYRTRARSPLACKRLHLQQEMVYQIGEGRCKAILAKMISGPQNSRCGVQVVRVVRTVTAHSEPECICSDSQPARNSRRLGSAMVTATPIALQSRRRESSLRPRRGCRRTIEPFVPVHRQIQSSVSNQVRFESWLNQSRNAGHGQDGRRRTR